MEDAAYKPSGGPGSALRIRLAMLLCICMSLFHLYTSGIDLLRQPMQRSIHVGFSLAIIYLLYPVRLKKLAWVDALLLAASVLGTGYVAVYTDDIATRGGHILDYEIVLGALTIIAVLEAARRVLGKALPLLATVFMFYCYWGNYAPGFLEIRGYSLQRIIQHMYLTNEGIFGVAIGVSSTYIFLFILFGAFLVAGGGARFFNNLSMALAGRYAGGPAKVAVLASGLMATINGSSIANAATVGTLTIPMMKKVGYSAEEAAGIEACASTGGQFMPPIMGAGAFIMAELLRMPYQSIAVAATLPAILYYLAVLVHVHFVARRDHIQGIDPGLRAWAILKRDGYLLLPIIIAIVMLSMNYTPLKAAFWAIASMMVLSGLTTRELLRPAILAQTLESGARGAVTTAAACAVVGFIVGTCSLTALGMSFSGSIISLTHNNLFLTMVVSMLACLLFGMGLPTTANYIVTSTIVAPIMLKMGVTGLAAHLFVFYFGIKADITPPVCLATITAAGIAKADPTKASIIAFTLALPSFFLPYLFVYSPEILLQGSIVDIALIVVAVICGILGITAFATRWLVRPIGIALRLACLAFGVSCYFPQMWLKFAGMTGVMGLVAILLARRRFSGEAKAM